MAPAYKLTYFDSTALAEPIRMLMKYGGIDFEDVCIELERWPEEKDSKFFFGTDLMFLKNVLLCLF